MTSGSPSFENLKAHHAGSQDCRPGSAGTGRGIHQSTRIFSDGECRVVKSLPAHEISDNDAKSALSSNHSPKPVPYDKSQIQASITLLPESLTGPASKPPEILNTLEKPSALTLQLNLVSARPDSELYPDYRPGDKDEELPPPNPLVKELSIPKPNYDQLVEEIKGIYAGLVSLENKIIEVHKHIKEKAMKLNKEQWQSLYGLHRSLMLEHYDFYLVTDHPNVTPVLRRLPDKYDMPARMWKYAIHIFLELMRETLPESREYLLGFLYDVYSIVGMLHETVTPHDQTWTECLGDLSRYRMAIEDEDESMREVWSNVSKYWYRQTSDYTPTTGRLYHHMAILSRANPLSQAFFYTKSLCTPELFRPTNESVMTLFKPMMEMNLNKRNNHDPVHCAFVAMHGFLFMAFKASSDGASGPLNDSSSASSAAQLLDKARLAHAKFREFAAESLTRDAAKWTENSIYIAMVNICALYAYSNTGYFFCDESSPSKPDTRPPNSQAFDLARTIFKDTFNLFLGRTPEPVTYSFLFTTLLFLNQLATYDRLTPLTNTVPWSPLSNQVNQQMNLLPESRQTLRLPFPRHSKEANPIPDDYNLRGFLFTKHYFPDDWFRNNLEESERLMERESTKNYRSLRIISLLHSLSYSTHQDHVFYDSAESRFLQK